MKKALLVLALSAISAASYAADPVLLRISHVTTAGSPKGMGADKFKSVVEKNSNGEIRVEVYHAGTKFGDREEMKALEKGEVEMLAPSVAKLNVFYKNVADNPWVVLEMPFLFNSLESVSAVEKAGVIEEMNQTLKVSYASVAGFWDNGLTYLSTPYKMTKWEDFQGLKMRIQPSSILKASVESWGATPRVLAYGELGTGTFYGSVNSSFNPPSNVLGSNLMTSQRYLYRTNNAYLGYVLLFNRKWWDGLSPAHKAVISKSLEETRSFQAAAARSENDRAEERIQNTGSMRVVDMDPALLARMKKESEQVVKVLSPSQKAYYDKIKAAVAKAPKK